MNQEYLTQAQYYIVSGRTLSDLKKLVADYRVKNPHLPFSFYPTTFRLLFISACHYGKCEIAIWLYGEFYKKFEQEEQEKLKPIFKQCLERVKKIGRSDRMIKWLERVQIELRDN